jgi:hypothetical protein
MIIYSKFYFIFRKQMIKILNCFTVKEEYVENLVNVGHFEHNFIKNVNAFQEYFLI